MAGFFALLEPLALRLPAGLLLGAIVGSFLATILIRWPRGESALGGRSRCDACGETLGPLALVPILSFIVMRGRCRHCGARIDRRHLAIELAAALVGLAAFAAHPLPLALVTAMLGWWLLLIAALDLEHHWLPDLLTLPLVPLGLAAAWAGFDTCSTASNHSLDTGLPGIRRTLANLDRVGIRHAGTARSAVEAAAPTIIDVTGDAPVVTRGRIPARSGRPRLSPRRPPR